VVCEEEKKVMRGKREGFIGERKEMCGSECRERKSFEAAPVKGVLPIAVTVPTYPDSSGHRIMARNEGTSRLPHGTSGTDF
jgi:hypothetical protein